MTQDLVQLKLKIVLYCKICHFPGEIIPIADLSVKKFPFVPNQNIPRTFGGSFFSS